MPSARITAPPKRDTYRRQTHRPLNCLAFILPMLLVFQFAAALYGTSLLAPRDLGRLLKHFGATAAYLPPLLIVLVLLVQHLFRRDRWKVQPQVLAGMCGESVGWTLPLIGLSYMTGRLIAQQAASGPAGETLFQQVALALGAGIYEEFIFRLLLISLAMLLLVDVFDLPETPVAVGVVIISAVLFSMYHFAGSQFAGAVSFPWAEFVFRCMAGAYLGWLYVFRGFGIAVGVHAFFDIYVVLRQM
ncbi:MAG: CPBP family intramembrane glutamic endopeptidase [Planctomycetota bacterium]|nr:CPBP family intramembrane glutamic endopeptidase [Planctomycetota bacterium]